MGIPKGIMTIIFLMAVKPWLELSSKQLWQVARRQRLADLPLVQRVLPEGAEAKRSSEFGISPQ